jgi:hypothetical protein
MFENESAYGARRFSRTSRRIGLSTRCSQLLLGSLCIHIPEKRETNLGKTKNEKILLAYLRQTNALQRLYETIDHSLSHETLAWSS